MEKQRCPSTSGDPDHRSLSARIKRESTRLRILEATMRVFARSVDDAPVIEDVVKEANIARGTFYKYFDSLDQALVAAGTQVNDRMIADIESVYEFLKEPWQRVCVGFRVYMVCARCRTPHGRPSSPAWTPGRRNRPSRSAWPKISARASAWDSSRSTISMRPSTSSRARPWAGSMP